MNQKIKIILLIIVIVIIIISYKISLNKKNDKSTISENITSNIWYNEDSGLYYITNKDGEILRESENEGELYIYTIDPDYDPKIPEE